MVKTARRIQPDVIVVTKGAFLAPETLATVKSDTDAVLVNYATDDPFNPKVSSSRLLASLPYFDVYACTKRAIMVDVLAAGCPLAVYVPFAYKPALHFPEDSKETKERLRYECEVAFIGTADPDRFSYFETLIRAIPGLNLKIYGTYWNRHPRLRRYHHGVARGREFRLALSGARIALNPLRQANRDGHTMRSFELPACGAFMLAERTDEHAALFREGSEMACFGSDEELVDHVRHYLANPEERDAIAANGLRAVNLGRHTYADRLEHIVDLVREKRQAS
jgi:spore maturation protein CgeB